MSIGLVDGKDPGKGCKFDVEWTCGDTQYRSGGGCDMAPDGGVLQGGCFAGGSSTSTFKTGATACPCDDPDAMGKLVRAQCLSQ